MNLAIVSVSAKYPSSVVCLVLAIHRMNPRRTLGQVKANLVCILPHTPSPQVFTHNFLGKVIQGYGVNKHLRCLFPPRLLYFDHIRTQRSN